jgi:pyrroline-5-carboxylate reductase
MKIGFIGCGNMGEAILKGMLEKKCFLAKDIFVCEKDKKRSSALSKKHKVKIISSVKELTEKVDIIILAVKPQDSQQIIKEMSVYMNKKKLIISIMAGVKIEKIEKAVGKSIGIVRTMPNMGAFIGASVTSISYNKNVSKKNKAWTEKIFSSIGNIHVVSQAKKDIITALSGSGPAYFFYIVEAFVIEGVKQGLSKKEATELIVNTMTASADIIKQTKVEPAKLRKMVTSKKGTTEAAIKVFDKKNIKKVITDAVKAAMKRSEQLSK